MDYEGDDLESWDLYFQVHYKKDNRDYYRDLIVNGGDVLVTQKNKKQYVRLMVDYYLVSSVKQQFDSFVKGFKFVCGECIVTNLYAYF